MNREYILQAEIISQSTPIRELLPLLHRDGPHPELLLLTDEKGKASGYVKSAALFRYLQIGTEMNWAVEAICESDYMVIREDQTDLIPFLGKGDVLIVADHAGRPLGVLKQAAFLAQHLASHTGTAIPDFLFSSSLGILLLSCDGMVLCANGAAIRLLGCKGRLSGRTLEEIWPAFPRKKASSSKSGYTLCEDTLLQWHFLDKAAEKTDGAVLFLSDASDYHTLQLQCSALQRQLNDLEEILDHINDEINITDENGVCIMVNSASERILGLNREELIGKTSQQLYREGVVSSYLTDAVIQQKRRMTNLQRTRTGRRIMVTANPILDAEGNIKRVVLNSRELSEMNHFDSPDALERADGPGDFGKLTDTYLRAKNLVAESPITREAVRMLTKVAETDSTVLLLGETGVGKSAFADLIHELSPRNQATMVKVNCAAIPESLIESELFGYSKGAFTGANVAGKAGLFQVADQGTIFLDEIGELSLSAQSKLLRVIQDQEFFQVGGSTPIKTNCRIVAATNKDLKELVEQGSFRQDLYYRLCVFPVMIPPLRSRREDIPPLIQKVVSQLNKRMGKNYLLHKTVVDYLVSYDWPGNIRELENFVERLVIISDSELITMKNIENVPLRRQPGESVASAPCLNGRALKDAVEEYEKLLLMQAMKDCRTTYELAEKLQLNQSTVVRKLARYDLKL